MDVIRLSILLMWVSAVAHCQDTPRHCGKSDDITNIGIISHAVGENYTFDELSKVCYGSIYTSLKELKGSIQEEERCAKKANVVIDELKSICSTLKKVYTFKTMFQNSLKSLGQIHKSMDYFTKFAEIIPAVGKMRKLITEKVLPMAMKALEYAYIGVRNVVVYFNMFLGQTKKNDLQKLLIEIRNTGTRACTESTSMGIFLSKLVGQIKSSRESSKVLLQAMFEIQNCANKECPFQAKDCLDCWKFNNNFMNVFSMIAKWKVGMKLCSRQMDGVMKQLNITNKLDTIFETGFGTITEIEQLFKILTESLEKSVKSVAPVEKHLLACCPCERQSPARCDEEGIKKSTSSVSCPLEYLLNFQITKLLSSIEKKVDKLRFTIFPIIDVGINIPAANFEIDVPKYFQQCFGSSSFQMKFTKLCSLLNKQFDIKVRSPALPGLEHSSITVTYSSLPEEIKLSCIKVKEAFKHFGKTMSVCVDRIAIAISSCSGISSNPDPGIHYCPCKISTVNADAKQPYCAIWKNSDLKTCLSLCAEKGYKPGKNPSGHNTKMDKTHGYPVCGNIKYYCKISDVSVRNGTVKCAHEYTFHDNKCQIIPNSGHICPVDEIECGSLGDPIKGVCWNYRFIQCAKDDAKHYPVCACKNNETFANGKLLCQYGNSQGVAPTPDSVLDLRKTSNCFERLGLDEDIKKDCGASMSPCVIQRPNVEPYQRCNYIAQYSNQNNVDTTPAENYKNNIRFVGIALTCLFALFLIIFLSLTVLAYIKQHKLDDVIEKIKKFKFTVLVFATLTSLILGLIFVINPEFAMTSSRDASLAIFGVCFLLVFLITIYFLTEVYIMKGIALVSGLWVERVWAVLLWLFLICIMIISLVIAIASIGRPDDVRITNKDDTLSYLKMGEVIP